MFTLTRELAAQAKKLLWKRITGKGSSAELLDKLL